MNSNTQQDKKIMFFDIDGTIVSETTGKIPESAVLAIRQARANGHLMFINTGRCMQNIEECFRSIGFDGYVCGCGTDIYYQDQELFHIERNPIVCRQIVSLARKCKVDIAYEAREQISYDQSAVIGPQLTRLILGMRQRNYDLSQSIDAEDFVFDKFIIWTQEHSDFAQFKAGTDPWFSCIDRGNSFYEFIPHGYSKATGIRFLLDYFHLTLEQAYAIGDSANDLPMLTYVPHSIAMGNSSPKSLFQEVSYVTTSVEEDGILHAMEHFHFLEHF